MRPVSLNTPRKENYSGRTLWVQQHSIRQELAGEAWPCAEMPTPSGANAGPVVAPEKVTTLHNVYPAVPGVGVGTPT